MIVFVVIAVLLVAATVALLSLPLWRSTEDKAAGDTAALSMQILREQMQEVEEAQASGLMDAAAAEKEKRELERRALEESAMNEAAAAEAQLFAARVADRSRRLMIAAIVAVPLLAGSVYAVLGSPGAVVAPPDGHAAAGEGETVTQEQIEAMVAKLAEKLAANPEDGTGWIMLARSYSMLGRFDDAVKAFERATAVLPPNADLYVDYADALAMAQGRQLTGAPEKMIAKALQLEPAHVKGLALSGSAAFERGDFKRAAGEWRKILSQVEPGSELARNIEESIAEAETRAGKKAAGSKASVGGAVSLADKLKGQVAPTDTVFIFARPVDGSRMPLAMKRIAVAQLPAEFTLDDSMAMTPGSGLAEAKQVVVGARISKSGDALARPGDFEGYSRPVAVGSKKVRVVIDTPVR